GERPLRHLPARDGYEHLRRRAGDLEVLEVEEVHVRARIHRAQAAVDGERLDRAVSAPALTRHDLVDVAGPDVVLGDLDAAHVAVVADIRLPLRWLVRLTTHPRDGRAKPLANVGDSCDRVAVGAFEVVAGEDVR